MLFSYLFMLVNGSVSASNFGAVQEVVLDEEDADIADSDFEFLISLLSEKGFLVDLKDFDIVKLNAGAFSKNVCGIVPKYNPSNRKDSIASSDSAMSMSAASMGDSGIGSPMSLDTISINSDVGKNEYQKRFLYVVKELSGAKVSKNRIIMSRVFTPFQKAIRLTTPEEELKNLKEVSRCPAILNWNVKKGRQGRLFTYGMQVVFPEKFIKVSTEDEEDRYISVLHGASGATLQDFLESYEGDVASAMGALGYLFCTFHKRTNLAHGDPNTGNILYNPDLKLFSLIDNHSLAIADRLIRESEAQCFDLFFEDVKTVVDFVVRNSNLESEAKKEIIDSFIIGYQSALDDEVDAELKEKIDEYAGESLNLI